MIEPQGQVGQPVALGDLGQPGRLLPHGGQVQLAGRGPDGGLVAGGMGYVDEAGTAVLCLSPPRLRDAPRALATLGAFMAGGAVAGSILHAVWPPLLWLFVAALGALSARAGFNHWRDRAVRKALDEAKPAGAWYLHNFAADAGHKGAGWALLVQVLDRSDREQRTLYLDTVASPLVAYYERAGFAVVVEVGATYAGEDLVVTRMVRRPAG